MNTELITPAVDFSSGTEDSVPYIKIEGAKDFDLCAVMECGQCFRFTRVEDSAHECEYSGVALGRFIAVAEDGDTLYFYNTDAAEFDAVWRGYFGLDTDYAAIKRDILSRSDREVLREAVEVGGGIRILRQDSWEALCSFIISQNNNIPCIRKLVRQYPKNTARRSTAAGLSGTVRVRRNTPSQLPRHWRKPESRRLPS